MQLDDFITQVQCEEVYTEEVEVDQPKRKAPKPAPRPYDPDDPFRDE